MTKGMKSVKKKGIEDTIYGGKVFFFFFLE